MSETKHSDSIFRNEQTRSRRAWIDRALASVKGKAESEDEAPEAHEESRKPHLYVVNADRSG